MKIFLVFMREYRDEGYCVGERDKRGIEKKERGREGDLCWQITDDAITTHPDLRHLGWALSALLLLKLFEKALDTNKLNLFKLRHDISENLKRRRRI